MCKGPGIVYVSGSRKEIKKNHWNDGGNLNSVIEKAAYIAFPSHAILYPKTPAHPLPVSQSFKLRRITQLGLYTFYLWEERLSFSSPFIASSISAA